MSDNMGKVCSKSCWKIIWFSHSLPHIHKVWFFLQFFILNINRTFLLIVFLWFFHVVRTLFQNLWRIGHWFTLIYHRTYWRYRFHLIHFFILENFWYGRSPCFSLFNLRILFGIKFLNLNTWYHLNILYHLRSVFVFALYS